MTGVVTLPEGAVVPEGALWTLQLQDTSLADAPALVLAEVGGVVDPAAPEISFEIPYDAAAILDTNTYTLQARIQDAAGSLLFVNDTAIPVLTGGAPSEGLSVPVVAVPPAEATASMVAAASVAPEAPCPRRPAPLPDRPLRPLSRRRPRLGRRPQGNSPNTRNDSQTAGPSPGPAVSLCLTPRGSASADGSGVLRQGRRRMSCLPTRRQMTCGPSRTASPVFERGAAVGCPGHLEDGVRALHALDP